MKLHEKIQKIYELIQYFELSKNDNLELDFEMLNELENLIGENPVLIKYQTICLHNAGYKQEAMDYLALCLTKHQQNYSLYELQFELLRYSTDHAAMFYTLSQMYKHAETEELQNNVLTILEEIVPTIQISMDELQDYMELFKLGTAATDFRSFPIDEYGNSLIRTNAFPGRDKNYEYLVNMYKTANTHDINSNTRVLHLYETLKGNFVQKHGQITVQENDVFAISSALKEPSRTNLCIENLEEEPVYLQLESSTFKYFRAKRSGTITIDADRDIFLSHFPKKKLEQKPKLILQLFLDGLSFDFLEKNGFETLMPNTYQFFRKGYINRNCHATGEWTLPSLMSMCSGKYTTNHFVYDTNAAHKGEQNNKLLQEYYEEAGYMTGRICCNWRGTPSYGYFKGINRSVYSPMINRMTSSEIIPEALEHLEAFKDFPNYLWLTVEDLHAVADGIIRGPLQELNINQYQSDSTKDDSEISVYRSYNKKKIEEYKATMTKIDFQLGFLYDYIQKNYKDEEFIVMLNSDHGQKFIEKSDNMFAKKRTNVPFMMRGRNVPCLVSDALMSNVDIYPTLLHLSGIECTTAVDGILLRDFGGEDRDYAISESIFSGRTYKLTINDKDHLFTLETKNNVHRDGTIDISEYDITLMNHLTKEDETELYIEKIEYYIDEMFNHLKEWISFE